MRIHDLRCGRPHQVGVRLDQPHVPVQVARILGKILLRAELGRVDENGDDHLVTFLPRLADQGEMPLVQVAHGRHETHCPGQGEAGGAQFGQGNYCTHIRNS